MYLMTYDLLKKVCAIFQQEARGKYVPKSNILRDPSLVGFVNSAFVQWIKNLIYNIHQPLLRFFSFHLLLEKIEKKVFAYCFSCQIPHVYFELTSQFLFNFSIILHWHDTYSTLDERMPSGSQFWDFKVLWWKFGKFLMSFSEAQVSFSSNFVSVLRAIKHNSSVFLLHETPYFLGPGISWKAQSKYYLYINFSPQKNRISHHWKLKATTFQQPVNIIFPSTFCLKKGPYFPSQKSSKQKHFSNQ